MQSSEIRQRFLDFFEKKGHAVVPSSSLIPTDPSVLFTTAGMQQFKPYFIGSPPAGGSPWGPNVASCQKCVRTSDIDEVGDERHLTFFEMLGNLSFGGYFKEEAIKLAHEFIFEELKLPKESAHITVFAGDPSTDSGQAVPEDKESAEIWKKLGIPENKILKGPREDNFWGPTGAEGPCGPTTEIHINGTEIWNIVFNEYYCDKNGELTPLKQKGVDTGMGLERLAMIVQGQKSVFETDLYLPLIAELKGDERQKRIMADHIKSAVFLAAEGILPSNVERGYVLRKILRRAIRYGKITDMPPMFLILLAQKAMEIYRDVYPELRAKQADILTVIQKEEEKFEKTLEQGLKEFNNFVLRKAPKNGKVGVAWDQRILDGNDAFYLYQSFGFPKELMQEICKEENIGFDEKGFDGALIEHQEISRAGREKKFGGHGLILDTGEVKAANEEELKKVTRLHTATHLLQAALRQILGPEVTQKGSDITAERLRFDFSFTRKLTPDELSAVESLVNEKIKEDLVVTMREVSFEAASAEGALTVMGARYPEQVKVYGINGFSKEVCSGPHVGRTGEIGAFKITKEESVAAGIRRIRAAVN